MRDKKKIKPNEHGGPYIFISYSRVIKDEAEKVIKLLQSEGYRVWFDEGLIPGSSYNDVIAKYIVRCEVFLCLLSEGYSESTYCMQEFFFAKEELKKPIVPVYVGVLDEIKASLPYGMRMWLAGVHSIEFRENASFVEQINASLEISNCRNEKKVDEDIIILSGEDAACVNSQELILKKKKSFSREVVTTGNEVGDKYLFGRYPQTAEGIIRTVEWVIIGKRGKRILLLCKYGIDSMPYNDRREGVVWGTSTLRKWLNNDFMNNCFNDEEQKKIVLTTVAANRNKKFNIGAGRDTQDHVFLLDIDEMDNFSIWLSGATDYAKKKGAYTESGSGNSFWWLRSPGNSNYKAAVVRTDGSINHMGYYIDRGDCCVRPALWIDLDR